MCDKFCASSLSLFHQSSDYRELTPLAKVTMYFGHGRSCVEKYFVRKKILFVNVVIPIAKKPTCFSYKDVRHVSFGRKTHHWQ